MSNRRTFIRDSLMTIAIALLPKVLRPALPEVEAVAMHTVSVIEKTIPYLRAYQYASLKINGLLGLSEDIEFWKSKKDEAEKQIKIILEPYES